MFIFHIVITPNLFTIFTFSNTALAQGDYGLTNTAKEAGIGTELMIDAPVFLGRISGAALAIAGSLFLFLMIFIIMVSRNTKNSG